MDWETRELTDQESAYRFVQWARSLGIDDGLTGCHLTAYLRRAGYGDEDAAEVLRDVGVVWHARTPQERLVDIAREMLRAGWTEATVRQVIDGLVTNARS